MAERAFSMAACADVLRHNMHHALSSSVAERALRIRLLQLCLTSGELAVLLCLMIAGDTSIEL